MGASYQPGDYHLRIREFHAWRDRLESIGVRVWNSPALVRWNADKRYLLDLTRRGIATIPTAIVGARCSRDVERIAASEGWQRFVVEPASSASGYETHAFDAPVDDADRAIIGRTISLGDALVQPFAEEIRRDGELSFTFIDGAYSHATLKRSSGREFRVQVEHGGSDEPADPPREADRSC